VLPLLRLAIIGLGTLVVPLDTMGNVAFPSMIAHFGVPTASVQWLVICYMLAQSSLMLVFGRLGDMLGYRRIFLIGTAWSAGAFLFCTLAPSFAWLLVGRSLQGIGAGLLLSCGPALATQLFPEVMRARVLGWYTMMFALGGALGPAIAGLLMARWGWVSVFSVRVPMSLLAFACAWSLPAVAAHARRERFDGAGALLLSLGIGTLLLALAELRGGFVLPVVLGSAGALCLVLYARRRGGAPPIIDIGLFRLPGFGFLTLASTGVNLAGFSVLLLVPFYLARFADLPITQAGLLLALAPLGTTLAAPLAGRLAGTVPSRRLMLVGMGAAALGLLALVATTGPAPRIGLLAAALLFQGLGLGVFQVAYFDVVTATLPLAARGVAGSLGLLTRTIGVVTGASLLILAFEGLRERALDHGLPAPDAFLTGFHAALLLAATLPLALAFGLRRR
jgi:MFS family permease